MDTEQEILGFVSIVKKVQLKKFLYKYFLLEVSQLPGQW